MDKKITFLEFEQVMACDLNKKPDPCIEICFDVDGYTAYQDSWLGKMIDKNSNKDVYWFGLATGGSQAHDYSSFEEFTNAKIFYDNKSLKEIWNLITIISIDGGAVDEVLPYFLRLQH